MDGYIAGPSVAPGSARASTRTRRGIASVVLAVLLAACSGGGDGGSSVSDPPQSSGPVTEVPPVSTEPTPSTEPEPVMPDVPAGVNWAASDVAPPTSAAPLPSFEEVTATAGVPPAPAGYPYRQSNYTAHRWDVAGVVLVSGGCSCWQGGSSAGVSGRLANQQYLFRSDDGGATWAQIDLVPALGNNNGYIDDIAEFNGSLFLQASISDDNRTSPSVIIVARSDDGGASWARVSTITGEYDGRLSLFGGRFGQAGENLVLVGGDVVCDFDGSSAVQSIGTSLQPRLWTSSDGGVTWTPQSKADTGLDTKPVPPADPSGCEGFDLAQRMDQYDVRPRAIDFHDGVAFVWSEDGERIATSTDGLTWQTAILDGAAPIASEFAEGKANSDAAIIYTVAEGFVAVNVEDRRTTADEATGSSSERSMVVWTSSDGSAWERQPLGRPIPSNFGQFSLFRTDNGLVLVETQYDNSVGDNVVTESWESVAGPFEEWQTCNAAANANCSYAEEVVGIEPGDDLSGINLTGVVLSELDLTDVSFAGATLVQSGIVDCVLDGTDFSNADLTFTSLSGDVATAVFDGAVVSNAFVDGGFFAADLSGATLTRLRVTLDVEPLPEGTSFAGQDLTDWSFDAYTAQGDLTGVDFSGANLSGTSFGGVDLTGANFSGATIDTVFFSTFGDFPVVCPDGLPLDEAQFGPAACRLPVS